MGVHDLWTIVDPVRESVPLYSLSGKTLAVDLSLWVCEAQHVQAMMGRVTKPHLRNLFFRVSSLTLMGVKLVFVMEGEAPKLKAETMNKRTQARYAGVKKGPAPKPTKPTKPPSRGRFNAVLRECAQMLDYLGVPWVTAAGEAEAMCAYLDSQGLVDGCITNDGDAFVYGARTVYRNFNMNTKDPQVDCYKTSRVQTELHLSREDLVGLAILLGCDYIPKGIQGVGREQALKLIKMIKGQTLLQRFIQWKQENNAGASEEVVKKVAHCNICRHPGSAKTHERGGCTLCDSKRFCQPQDFDYQCPCDWHQYEQTRQESSFEANIKKKTLANLQFPFTEIIQEFLISKDKPVSHFKRRQPNMLLMQKFAYDKMEWPKHYTSEKVLVLMTYAELMNKKYGREMSSQICPLRIFKPRVRNAIPCFEIIWSVPEHFVFPEDSPAEDQHEVRTVEEESLFHVAYPEVVESYMRDKALAEEKKTKKKKPKTKKEKEKATDVSDGISDLLAQMSLQTSSTTQPQMQLASRSSTEEPAVVVLDSPVNHKQHQKSKDEQSSVGDLPGTPLAQTESEAVDSPCVSAVIKALHLSNIDWDSASFTSSPTPQPATSLTTEPNMSKTTEDNARRAESEHTGQKNSSGIKDSDLCDTEFPLRERLLLRNTAKALPNIGMNFDVDSKQRDYRLAPLKHISHNNPKPNVLIPSKISSNSISSVKEPVVSKEEPLTVKKHCVTVKAETGTLSAKQVSRPLQTDSKTQLNCNVSLKPPQNYKFVRKAVSSSVPPQRCYSDPGQSIKDKSIKKSVCMSVCLSSEESDAENQQRGPRRKTKIKPVTTSVSASRQKTKKPAGKTAGVAQFFRPKPQSDGSHTETSSVPESTRSSVQEVSPADEHVFPHTPASPVLVLDSDDSVICGESPLPLAERLRLKFLQ